MGLANRNGAANQMTVRAMQFLGFEGFWITEFVTDSYFKRILNIIKESGIGREAHLKVLIVRALNKGAGNEPHIPKRMASVPGPLICGQDHSGPDDLKILPKQTLL